MISDRGSPGDDPAPWSARLPPHPTTLVATISSVAVTVMRTQQSCHDTGQGGYVIKIAAALIDMVVELSLRGCGLAPHTM